MKVKIVWIFIAIFISAQVLIAQEKTVNIECNLVISETEWIKDSQLTATVTVKNNSDRKVKISLPPHFRLAVQNENISYSQNFGDEYSAYEKEEDHIIIKKTGNSTTYKIRQFFEFSLKRGESKTVKFNVSKLGWNLSISSLWIYRDWYYVIPNGNYELYYLWNYNLGKGKDIRRINIISNKLSVKLNREK